MTTTQLLLLLSVSLGGGALAVWVMWLNRRERQHAPVTAGFIHSDLPCPYAFQPER